MVSWDSGDIGGDDTEARKERLAESVRNTEDKVKMQDADFIDDSCENEKETKQAKSALKPVIAKLKRVGNKSRLKKISGGHCQSRKNLFLIDDEAEEVSDEEDVEDGSEDESGLVAASDMMASDMMASDIDDDREDLRGLIARMTELVENLEDMFDFGVTKRSDK